MQNRKRDRDVQNRLLDSVGEGEGETSAWAWCTGKTQRNRVEREAGGVSGWGTHVNPWLIHVNVWQKPLQCCKVISLQLIKINGKKIETHTQICPKCGYTLCFHFGFLLPLCYMSHFNVTFLRKLRIDNYTLE